MGRILNLKEAVSKSVAQGFADDIGATTFKIEDGQFMAYVPKKYSDKVVSKIMSYLDDMGFKNVSVGNDSESLAKYMGLEKEYKAKKGVFVEADIPKGKIIKENKDLKELKKIVADMIKQGIPYNKNQEFRDFKDKALEIAKEKGLRVGGIDVMQAIDKVKK